MNIVVTGGAGFIGSNLVERLLEENHKITVIDNMHSGSAKNLNGTRNRIQLCINSCGDILSLANSSANITNVDIIFHLGIPSSSPMYKDNPKLVGSAVSDTISVFEHAKRTNAKVIFASSSSLYNGLKPPHMEDMEIQITDYYTEARLYIERIAKLYNMLHGVKSVGIRFFSVYGPHEEAKGKYANMVSQFLWDMIKDKSPIIYGDGKQTRDFTYISDIIDALTMFMDEEFEFDIYNAGSGVSYSFNDLVDMLNVKLNKNIEPTYIKMPMNNYVADTLSDLTKIMKLGYTPKYSLDQGIDKTIQKYVMIQE